VASCVGGRRGYGFKLDLIGFVSGFAHWSYSDGGELRNVAHVGEWMSNREARRSTCLDLAKRIQHLRLNR
jgi:hypothetical protein